MIGSIDVPELETIKFYRSCREIACSCWRRVGLCLECAALPSDKISVRYCRLELKVVVLSSKRREVKCKVKLMIIGLKH